MGLTESGKAKERCSYRTAGRLHIYCGDGKGKTSAATGLAIRAAGWGMQVLFARFLKTEESGELRILDQIPEIRIIHMERSFGFFRTLTEREKREACQMYGDLWQEIRSAATSGAFDMIVIDEFMSAYRYGMIPHDQAVCFLKERPEHLEIVLTGRDPDEELLALADYVSEIRKIKHPYDQGLPARKGIEY